MYFDYWAILWKIGKRIRRVEWCLLDTEERDYV